MRDDGHHLDEATLLARAHAGDRAAAARLVDMLGPKLMAFCLRMTGGNQAEAEDAVQEAFLRLWRKAGDWDADGPAQLSTWLGRVAANLIIDRQRRAKRQAPMDDAVEPEDPTPGVEAKLIAAERRAALRTARTSSTSTSQPASPCGTIPSTRTTLPSPESTSTASGSSS